MSGTVRTKSRRMVDLLVRLVDRSLVVYEAQPGGPGRYRLLETTRQYAREKLQESGQETAVSARHRDYFLLQLESGLDGRVEYYDWDRVKWAYRTHYQRWCEAERDNCREALRFSLAEPDGAKTTLRLGAMLFSFWFDTGEISEGMTWLNAALQKDEGSPGRERMRVLRSAGILAMMEGDFAASRRLTEEGLAIAREHEPGFVVHAMDILGKVGDPARRQAVYEERLMLAREDGNVALIAFALTTLGKYLNYTGHRAEARPLLQDGLDYALRSQDGWYIADGKEGIAELEESEGNIGEALRLYEEAVALLGESDDKSCLSVVGYAGIGRLKSRMGDFATMRAHLREAIREFQRRGDALAIIVTLADIAIGEYRALAAPTPQRMEWCARLLGAAGRQGEVRGLFQNFAPPLFLSEILQMRAALGEETFDRACAEGAAMTLEEAVEYALREQDDL